MNALPAGLDPAQHELPRPIPAKQVVRLACRFLAIAYEDLVSPRRAADLVEKRQIVMFALRELTSRSYPEIGVLLGNRDHSTVIHGVRRIGEEIERDPDLRQRVIAFLAFVRAEAGAAETEEDAFAVAQRVAARPSSALGVSVEMIRHFAAIVLAARDEALRQETSEPDPEVARLQDENAALRATLAEKHPLEPAFEEFTRAHLALERASSAAERSARARLEKASLALALAGEKHFHIKRTWK